MRIYPMPKINYFINDDEELEAQFGCFHFALDKGKLLVLIDNDDCTVLNYVVGINESQTFEQAVTEWVRNWVKENFEPIILPDEVGYESEDYKNKILELNKNIIKVEE